MWPDDLSSLEEIYSLFRRAEQKIKAVEDLLGEGLAIAPVNQLRYVSFHLLKGLFEQSPEQRDEDLRRAKRHCQRALYDASEIGVSYLLREIHGFQSDYKNVEITPILPNWHDMLKEVKEAQRTLESNDKEKEEKCEICDRHFETLRGYVEQQMVAREELNKKLRNQRSKLILSIMGLAVALFMLIATISGCY